MKKVSVIGSGGWGTALAVMLDKYGHDVTIWCRREEAAKAIKENGENSEYLPNIPVRETIKVTADDKEAVENAEIVINAVPSKHVRTTMTRFSPILKEGQIIVNVAKGLEGGTYLRLSQVIKECVPQCEVCTMVGPTHAEEVGKGIPTVCAVSCDNMATAKMVQSEFGNPTFRLYTNADTIGMEMGAALKNIIALAAGMSDGLGFGDNTKAALITRGLAEICRLGIAMGGKLETFMGLSGVGDLIVTCTSMHSRNRRAGILLGQGKSLEETLAEVHMVVEGANTAKAALMFSEKYNVDMPIIEAINEVLYEGKDARKAVIELMMRSSKDEINFLKNE